LQRHTIAMYNAPSAITDLQNKRLADQMAGDDGMWAMMTDLFIMCPLCSVPKTEYVKAASTAASGNKMGALAPPDHGSAKVAVDDVEQCLICDAARPIGVNTRSPTVASSTSRKRNRHTGQLLGVDMHHPVPRLLSTHLIGRVLVIGKSMYVCCVVCLRPMQYRPGLQPFCCKVCTPDKATPVVNTCQLCGRGRGRKGLATLRIMAINHNQGMWPIAEPVLCHPCYAFATAPHRRAMARLQIRGALLWDWDRLQQSLTDHRLEQTVRQSRRTRLTGKVW
jgi:hypothetical protein